MKAMAVNFFNRPIWVIIINKDTAIKIQPPEQENGSADPIVIALHQWQAMDGYTGHYQSVLPQPCILCLEIWASKYCANCNNPLCQSCQCQCSPNRGDEEAAGPVDLLRSGTEDSPQRLDKETEVPENLQGLNKEAEVQEVAEIEHSNNLQEAEGELKSQSDLQCPDTEAPPQGVEKENDKEVADMENSSANKNIEYFKTAYETEKCLKEALQKDMRILEENTKSIILKQQTELRMLREKIRFLQSGESHTSNEVEIPTEIIPQQREKGKTTLEQQIENMVVESPASIWDVDTVVPQQRERRKTTTEQKKDTEELIRQKIGEGTDLNLRIDNEIENKGAGIRVSIF